MSRRSKSAHSDTRQCKGITRYDTRCKNTGNFKTPGYCHHHEDQSTQPGNYIAEAPCSGNTGLEMRSTRNTSDMTKSSSYYGQQNQNTGRELGSRHTNLFEEINHPSYHTADDQFNGITKQGRRCTRETPVDTIKSSWYCWQHENQKGQRRPRSSHSVPPKPRRVESWFGLRSWREYNYEGRRPREDCEDAEIEFFRGNQMWHLATSRKDAKNILENYNVGEKGGVYEWAIVPPDKTNAIAVYIGKAKKLKDRLINAYFHKDGIYPKNECLKTELFKDVQARGFKMKFRFVAGFVDPERVEKKILSSSDYAFNSMHNGNQYREPKVSSTNRITDYPVLFKTPQTYSFSESTHISRHPLGIASEDDDEEEDEYYENLYHEFPDMPNSDQDFGQCKGITRDHTRCKNTGNFKTPGYCHHHEDQSTQPGIGIASEDEYDENLHHEFPYMPNSEQDFRYAPPAYYAYLENLLRPPRFEANKNHDYI